MLLKWKYAQQDRDRVREHTNSKERMKNAQAEELERIKRQEVILQKLEKREAKSFERLAKKLSMRKEQIREMVLKEDRKRLQKEKERSHTLELSF